MSWPRPPTSGPLGYVVINEHKIPIWDIWLDRGQVHFRARTEDDITTTVHSGDIGAIFDPSGNLVFKCPLVFDPPILHVVDGSFEITWPVCLS